MKNICSLKDSIKFSEALSLIYINLPFCQSFCSFCCFAPSFGKEALCFEKYSTDYIKAIKREIKVKSLLYSRRYKYKLKAISFGGGTPTLLKTEQIKDILICLKASFDLSFDTIQDISIEATPETIDLEKVKELITMGFNRISLGVQTFDGTLLKNIKRNHSVSDFYNAYDICRKGGFENINIDLMYGLKGQSFEQVKKDLEIAISLAPEHITPSPYLYKNSFSKKNNSDLDKSNMAFTIKCAKYIHKRLPESGYFDYLHKYFSLPGKESVTELVYAYSVPCIGIGAGALSSDATTSKNIPDYIKKPVDMHRVKGTPYINAFMRGLMFREGVEIKSFNKRFNVDIEQILYDNSSGVRTKTEEMFVQWCKKRYLKKIRGYISIPEQVMFSEKAWQFYVVNV